MGFFKNEKGWQCQKNQDGSQTCRRFEQDKNQRIASGTEVTITADPSTGCEAVLGGDVNTILDSEDADIKRITKKVSAACKRGLI